MCSDARRGNGCRRCSKARARRSRERSTAHVERSSPGRIATQRAGSGSAGVVAQKPRATAAGARPDHAFDRGAITWPQCRDDAAARSSSGSHSRVTSGAVTNNALAPRACSRSGSVASAPPFCAPAARRYRHSIDDGHGSLWRGHLVQRSPHPAWQLTGQQRPVSSSRLSPRGQQCDQHAARCYLATEVGIIQRWEAAPSVYRGVHRRHRSLRRLERWLSSRTRRQSSSELLPCRQQD
jgi:hypothetical protein